MGFGAVSKVFRAMHGGQCGCCEKRFGIGTPVRYEEGVLVVADCDGAADPELLTPEQIAAARAAMCPSCFLVHAGEC